MSYNIVPESAPFSAEQRAWLNGFLAGMLGTLDVGQAQGVNAVSLSAAASTLLPPAASMTDDTELNVSAEQDEDLPWHEPSLSSAERMALADGRPLPQRMMAAMAQLNCGSCGYVCKTYAEALADGSEKNLTLCSPGGSETAKLLRQLQKEGTASTARATAASALTTQPGTAQPSTTQPGTTQPGTTQPDTTQPGIAHAPPQHLSSGSRSQPIVVQLKSNTRLNSGGSAKDTRHLAIDLSGTSLTYRVGDALGILPTNCETLVRQVCQAAGVPPQTLVSVDNQSISVEKVLAERCLRTIPLELVERARARVDQRPKLNGAVASDAGLIDRLQQFAESDEFGDLDVYEFLLKFEPLDLTAADLVETLSPLRPRLYSIASSQSQTPREVHLTVGRVEDVVRGRARKGVASTMLVDRLPPGALLRVFVQPNHGAFTVPADSTAPMIMVGPGTGIAPFIAFLQQRLCDGATGQNWLFFGDQKRSTDFLYEEQLTAWQRSGHLARLDLAFSRDGDEKVYVQQRMREHGAELFRWLESGSYFFVCGDAKRMARDVERTLLEIIAQQGRLSSDAAKKYMAQLKQARRYVCDVY